MSYIVICTSSASEGGRDTFEQATRRTFPTRAEAQAYAFGVSPSRRPLVVPLEPPTCATCKHWHRANDKGWEGQQTGIPIGDQSYSDEGPGPRTEHGHCQRIQHTHTRSERPLGGLKLTRRANYVLSAAPAVVCDSEEYCAWLCTLPTFSCVLHEPTESA